MVHTARMSVAISVSPLASGPNAGDISFSVADCLSEETLAVEKIYCAVCDWKSVGDFDEFVKRATLPDPSALLALRDRAAGA